MSRVRFVFLADAAEPWRELIAPAPATARGRRIQSVLVVPGASTFARRMAVAGSTPAQMRAAALAALAPDLAAPAADSVAAVGALEDDLRLVCIADRAVAEGWIATARARGFEPDCIIPDYALLPAPRDDRIVAARHGADTLVRGPAIAFACQHDLLPLLLPGQTPDMVDLEAEALGAVRDGRLAAAPDFGWLRRPADAARPLPVARIAATAAAALALAVSAPWIHALRLDGAADDFRDEAAAVAHGALPGASRIVNPRAQLEAALLPRRNAADLLAAAAAIVEGASASPGVTLVRIEAEAGASVMASLSAPSADALAPLRAHLAARGLHVVETAGAPAAGRLPIDLAVTPRTGGAAS